MTSRLVLAALQELDLLKLRIQSVFICPRFETAANLVPSIFERSRIFMKIKDISNQFYRGNNTQDLRHWMIVHNGEKI